MMKQEQYKFSELTSKIIGCGMKVHATLCNGFQEQNPPNHTNQINHSSDSVLASENAVGSEGSTAPTFRLNTANFDGVFQYGSDFNNEKLCHQDGIAPQIGINSNGLVPNVFIPKTEKYEPIRNFLDAHYSDNYGWIFTDLDQNQKGYVKKRNQ